MDLRAQLENSTEKNWNKEKMELLERFDNERKEWECQWKVMQKKIEELYQEVKLRRESNMNAFDNKAIHSKVRQQPVHSSISEWSDTPGLNSYSLDKESLLNKPEKESKDTRNKKKNHIFAKNNLSFENNKESEDSLGLKTTKNYTQDLNIALKELAKVSEDLCSYQEEIRKKSNHRRKKLLPFLGESTETGHTQIKPQKCSNDMQSASNAFETEERKNRKNLMGPTKCLKEMPSSAPGQKKDAPPIPPRSTSRHLTSSLSTIVQLSEELGNDTGYQNKSKSQEHPIIDAAFAMQHDVPVPPANEWKSLTGPEGARERDCKLPAGFCNRTWSCDTSKAGNATANGSSFHFVPKSCSDGNMVPQKEPSKLQSNGHCIEDFYVPMCDTLGDSGYRTGKTQRNETLEAKIDEFNRILFHTDKGQKYQEKTEIPSLDPKPSFVLQEYMTNKTQNEDVSCVLNPRLALRKEEKTCNPSKKVKTIGQQRQLNGLLSGYQHMLHEHDWKPSNLSGRPRSADSRSNYGVVEKLLKNYEKSTSLCSSKFHKEKWALANSASDDCSCETFSNYFEMLQTDEKKQESQKNSARHIGLYSKQGKEKQKFPEVSMPAKQATGKGFSRPARPANRRLPSRWASRSPSAPPAVRRTALN